MNIAKLPWKDIIRVGKEIAKIVPIIVSLSKQVIPKSKKPQTKPQDFEGRISQIEVSMQKYSELLDQMTAQLNNLAVGFLSIKKLLFIFIIVAALGLAFAVIAVSIVLFS